MDFHKEREREREREKYKTFGLLQEEDVWLIAT